jgi:hypothetical protein
MAGSARERLLTNIQREVEAELKRPPSPHDAAPLPVVAPNLAMPDYIEHRNGATEIGKLSAEAIVREFEAAAKEIEAMGAELTERVKQSQAMARNAFAVTEELKDVAARYREEAKRVFLQIEDCSLVTVEVSKICADLKEKIAASSR